MGGGMDIEISLHRNLTLEKKILPQLYTQWNWVRGTAVIQDWVTTGLGEGGSTCTETMSGAMPG